MSAVTPKVKFNLANRILLDRTLTPVTRLVGWFIADHINTQRGYAWPPQSTIATALNINEKSVRRSVKELGDYFDINRAGRANEYRPRTPDNMSAIERSTPDNLSTTPDNLSKIPDKNDPPSLETLLTSSDSAQGAETEKREIEKKKDRRKPAKPLPDNWTPSIATMDKAKGLGLSDLDVSRELEKFRNHARQNDRRCRNWDAAADNWMIKAADFRGLKPKDNTPTNGTVLSFPALPGSPQWQAWRTRLRDMDSPQSRSLVRELDRRELEGRPFSFDAEWPPGHQAAQA
jgi:Helix-turn-helix domain